MAEQLNNVCCYCGETFPDLGDLRPYGPDGANTCFDCAMATPERERLAEQMLMKAFNKASDDAGSGGMIVIHVDGPPEGVPRNKQEH